MWNLNDNEIKVLTEYYKKRLKGNPLDGSAALRLESLKTFSIGRKIKF